MLAGFIVVTFNVLMAVNVIYVLWNLTPCSLVDRLRY